MRILGVGAHPDDIEFGMCGTMIKLSEEGNECFGLVLTKGEMGTRGTDEIRREEMKNAARISGYTLETMDLGDTRIQDNPETRMKVANAVRKFRPDVVFAPYHTNNEWHKDGMAHMDHTTTGHLVRNSLRIAKFEKVRLDHPAHLVNGLAYFMVPIGMKPTILNDVSKYTDKMREAMFAHASQIDEKMFERLMIWRKSYGFLIGVDCAEPFIVENPMKFDLNLLR